MEATPDSPENAFLIENDTIMQRLRGYRNEIERYFLSNEELNSSLLARPPIVSTIEENKHDLFNDSFSFGEDYINDTDEYKFEEEPGLRKSLHPMKNEECSKCKELEKEKSQLKLDNYKFKEINDQIKDKYEKLKVEKKLATIEDTYSEIELKKLSHSKLTKLEQKLKTVLNSISSIKDAVHLLITNRNIKNSNLKLENFITKLTQ